MTDQSEDVKLPVSKWLLTFDSKCGLESAFNNYWFHASYNNMKRSTYFMILNCFLFFLYYLVAYLLDDQKGNFSSESIDLRTRYWGITRIPFAILIHQKK